MNQSLEKTSAAPWRRALNRHLRPLLVAVCAAAAASYTAGAVAQQGDGVSPRAAAIEQQLEAESQRADAYVQQLWTGALDKARADQLNAKVDADEAERILTAALDLPADPAARERVETGMIGLTSELRAAGDLPSLDDPARFDGAGGPFFQGRPEASK